MYCAELYSSLGKLIRYADDFVIICRTKYDAEKAMQKVAQVMELLKLTLHPGASLKPMMNIRHKIHSITERNY